MQKIYTITPCSGLVKINKKMFFIICPGTILVHYIALAGQFEHHYFELTGFSPSQNSVTVRPGRTSHNISKHVCICTRNGGFQNPNNPLPLYKCFLLCSR